MAAVSYGHVAIVPKGVWSAEVQYEPCNLVEYNGSSYVAKLQPPIGTLPTDTQYWQVSAVGAKKATSDSLGLVEPDNKTTEVDETGVLSVKESTDIIKKSDGTLSLNTTFEEATELANIIAGEAIKEVLGKVSKSIAATMNLDQNALLKNMLSGEDVDDASKIPTSAFVHTLYNRIGMGTDLSAGDATNLTQAVNDLNSNLAIVSSCISNVYIKKISNEGKYTQVFATSIIDSSHFCGLVIADGGLYSFHNIGNVTALVNRSTYKVVCSNAGNLARLSITGMGTWDECVVISNRDFKLTHE